jgi:GDPmannose 4,6-dehydratase
MKLAKMSVVVTGAAGQDGLILTAALADLGFEVFGVHRFQTNGAELSYLSPKVTWVQGLRDGSLGLQSLGFHPDVIIHLAGLSSVSESWEHYQRYIVENSRLAVEVVAYCASTNVPLVFASSSEVFSRGDYVLSESTEMRPSSPYGVSKATGVNLIRLLRDQERLTATVLFMLNHESPLRGPSFLTRALTSQILEAQSGRRNFLEIGSLKSAKDFSWAPDFVGLMCATELWFANDDYVLSSGIKTSVLELAESGLKFAGLDLDIREAGGFFRPDDLHPVGDSSKAYKHFGYLPRVPGVEIIPKNLELEQLALGMSVLERRKFMVSQLTEEVLEINEMPKK